LAHGPRRGSAATQTDMDEQLSVSAHGKQDSLSEKKSAQERVINSSNAESQKRIENNRIHYSKGIRTVVEGASGMEESIFSDCRAGSKGIMG